MDRGRGPDPSGVGGTRRGDRVLPWGAAVFCSSCLSGDAWWALRSMPASGRRCHRQRAVTVRAGCSPNAVATDRGDRCDSRARHRTRSAGASSTWRPRGPAETKTVGVCERRRVDDRRQPAALAERADPADDIAGRALRRGRFGHRRLPSAEQARRALQVQLGGDRDDRERPSDRRPTRPASCIDRSAGYAERGGSVRAQAGPRSAIAAVALGRARTRGRVCTTPARRRIVEGAGPAGCHRSMLSDSGLCSRGASAGPHRLPRQAASGEPSRSVHACPRRDHQERSLDLRYARPVGRPRCGRVAEEGYTSPPRSRQQAIPLVLAGRDVLAAAQTGTGKTAAFVLPILDRLRRPGQHRFSPARHPVRALILVPDARARDAGRRERPHLRPAPSRSARPSSTAAIPMEPQIKALRAGVEILVATPGRLLDLVGQRVANLGQVEILVLDEADRMLDMGFLPDIQRIIALLPAAPPEPDVLGHVLRRDPAPVGDDPATIRRPSRSPRATRPLEAIRQLVYPVDRDRKEALLAHLIRQRRPAPGARVHPDQDRPRRGSPTGSTAKGSTPWRSTATGRSRNGRARSRSSRAARSGSSWRPTSRRAASTSRTCRTSSTSSCRWNPQDYIHRIGRTGRAGATGEAISPRLHRRDRPAPRGPAHAQAGDPMDGRGRLHPRPERRTAAAGCTDGPRSDIARASRPPQARPAACTRRGGPERLTRGPSAGQADAGPADRFVDDGAREEETEHELRPDVLDGVAIHERVIAAGRPRVRADRGARSERRGARRTRPMAGSGHAPGRTPASSGGRLRAPRPRHDRHVMPGGVDGRCRFVIADGKDHVISGDRDRAQLLARDPSSERHAAPSSDRPPTPSSASRSGAGRASQPLIVPSAR